MLQVSELSRLQIRDVPFVNLHSRRQRNRKYLKTYFLISAVGLPGFPGEYRPKLHRSFRQNDNGPRSRGLVETRLQKRRQ